MEPNLRDTPLRRFNTFWWGLALFLAFAIAGVVIKKAVANNVIDQETEKGKARAEAYRTITSAQDEERNTYKDNGDGTVQVKPEDVFGLGKEMGLLEGPKPSEMKHNRTFGEEPAAAEAPAAEETTEEPAVEEAAAEAEEAPAE